MSDIRQEAGDHALQIGRIDALNVVLPSIKAPIPFQAPPLPMWYVERSPELERIRASLKTAATSAPQALVISAIHGLGGIGKTTLAAGVAATLRDDFAGGTLWATLGRTPDLLSAAAGWIQALGDFRFRPPNVHAATAHLRTLLRDGRLLIVIDDAWSGDDVKPLLVGGPQCVTLVTTRREWVASEIGARLENLDVLSRDQSLDLLARRLGRPLEAKEREEASDLAEAVGDLPLALELAAAQIGHRRGVGWTGLTEEISAEVARLEALDTIADQMKGYVKLEATFNTSLSSIREASLLAWESFVWLGITVEDSTIAAPMAATLWEVPVEKATLILEYLRGEALLVPFGETTVGGRTYPAFQIHDLLHDVARRLLTRCAPDGLGFRLAEAHERYVMRVKRRTRGRWWHLVIDDGYVLQRLAWHMIKAERHDLLDALLLEEDERGRNGWYATRVAAGQLAGYIEDLMRAWDAAERHDSLAYDGLFALIKATVNSLAENIPPRLLVRIVETKKWTARQALAYVMQAPTPTLRARSLFGLLPSLDGDLRIAALREIVRWIDTTSQTATSNLVARSLHTVPADWIVPIVLRYGDEGRVVIIDQAAPRMNAEQCRVCGEIAMQMRDEVRRCQTLLAVASHLPVEERETIYLLIRDETFRILRSPLRESVVWSLADAAPDLITPDMLEMSMLNRNAAMRLVRRHAHDLPPLTLGAFALTLSGNLVERSDIDLLAVLLPRLPEEVRETIEDRLELCARNATSVSVVAAALRCVSASLPLPDLEAIVKRGDRADRADRVMLMLSVALGNPGLRPAWWRDLPELIAGLNDAQQQNVIDVILAHLDDRTRILAEDLLPGLTPRRRARVLAKMIVQWPETQERHLPAFLELAPEIGDSDTIVLISTFIEVLSGESAERCAAAVEKFSAVLKAGTLLKLASRMHRKAEVIQKIVTVIVGAQLGDEWILKQIPELVPLCDRDAIPKICDRIMKNVADPALRVRVLLAFAAGYGEKIPSSFVEKIFAALATVTTGREPVLTLMSEALPDEYLMRLFDVAQELGRVTEQDFETFLREIPNAQGGHMLALPPRRSAEAPPAENRPVPRDSILNRAEALATDLEKNPGAAADARVSAFTAITRVRGIDAQLSLLNRVLPLFDDAMMSHVCDWLMSRPESDRARLLEAIVPYLTPISFPEAFAVWLSLRDGIFDEGKAFLDAIPDYFAMEALEMAHDAPDDVRASTILRLLLKVRAHELPHVGFEICGIEAAKDRQRALFAFANLFAKYPLLTRRRTCRSMLHALSTRTRDHVFFDLHALGPAIRKDGGTAVNDLRRYAELVFKWWR